MVPFALMLTKTSSEAATPDFRVILFICKALVTEIGLRSLRARSEICYRENLKEDLTVLQLPALVTPTALISLIPLVVFPSQSFVAVLDTLTLWRSVRVVRVIQSSRTYRCTFI